MEQLIKNLINQGEKINTEFKESKIKLPKNLFETVCAFLNRFGGNIILGVSDNKEIIGIDESCVSQIKKDFANLCNNTSKISPTIYLKMEELKIEEVNLHVYKTFEEAKIVIFEFIESWYNRRRIHSSIGYKIPYELENQKIC